MRVARLLMPVLLALGLAGPVAAQAAPRPLLLPWPAEIRQDQGSLSVQGLAVPAAGDAGLDAARARLLALLGQSHGPHLAAASGRGHAIRFVRDPAVAGAETYTLAVTPSGATVRASGDAGLFYGAETLWQLLCAAGPSGQVPALTIRDQPRFAWRGLMLDSARHMQPVAWIEHLIDRMAAAKLNTFHWHLTDDQGWRLPVPGYPRLTTVGAYRTPAGAAAYDAQGRPVRYGGFYTEAEIRSVVAYGAARHVTIVPEVDMPGHMTAAIAAYPELGSTSNPPPAPTNEWGILPNLLNPDQPTFRFVDAVLDELVRLFPGRYIHVGGDEAVKDQWRANPAIQTRMKALGLRDEDALQAWFTARVGESVARRGRRLIGWDEILAGGVPADATVMSWRGIDGAVTAAKAGHDTVLSPAPILYLDNRQGVSADEPPGRGELVGWERLYGFDPAPAALTADERRHILGLQGNLWTEHVRTTAQADRMLWPRAAIIAELGWAPPSAHDWAGFSTRLTGALARWRTLGWGFDETPLAPVPAPSPMHRVSAELDLCGNAIPLRLEDDAPTAGTRRIFWADILHPCWIWKGAAVGGVTRVAADVGRVPFNFSIGADRDKMVFDKPETAAGELLVRFDRCDGPIVARVPLAAAVANPGVTRVEGAIAAPAAGSHDLCITFAQSGPDPLWLLDGLTLLPGPPA